MKEKILNLFRKYKDIILIILTLFSIITFFNLIWFTKDNYEIFIKNLLIITIIYLILFKLDLVEKYIIKFFTLIMLFWVILLIVLQKELWIDNSNILLMIWWVIAFWYWYKKYEQDKELSIIQKYTTKYNEIKKDKNLYDFEKYKELLNLWYEEFYMYNKWYISKKLWNEWEFWISNDIYNFILNELKNNIDPLFYLTFINWYSDYSFTNMIWKIPSFYRLREYEDLLDRKIFIENWGENFFIFINKIILKKIKFLSRYWKNSKKEKLYFDKISEFNPYNNINL